MCVGELALLLITGINGIWDVRKKEIFLIPTVIAGIGGVFFSILSGESCVEVLTAFFPGLIVLAAAAFSEGGIGAGDAVVVLAIGAWEGVISTFIVLAISLMLAFVAAMLCFLTGRRQKEMPFVPFLFAAGVLHMFL